MEISKKVHCDVPFFVKKNEKLNEERLFYDQSIKDAQNEIKLKNDKLQEIDQRNVTEKSRFFKIHQNDEGMRYKFGKRKSTFTNKDSLCKKILRATNEGRDKQHDVDNASKKKIRDTPEGKKKNQEVSNEAMKKVRETPDGKKRQKEVDDASKKRIRDTVDGKKKQQEVDIASKKTIRDTFDRKKKQQEVDNA